MDLLLREMLLTVRDLTIIAFVISMAAALIAGQPPTLFVLSVLV